jgi:hypothetical protein
MKRAWLVVALVLVLGAAFCVQATSTWKLGQRQNLADLALPALVVLLEVGSITAAAIFFQASSRGLRTRAILMLAITAGLGAAGGVVAYGWLVGIVVGTLMVGLVELVGAYRHETAAETTQAEQDKQDNHLREIAAEPVVEPEPQVWSGPDTVELPRQPDTLPIEVQDETEPVRPQLEAVKWSVDQIVADLREQGVTDPSGQYIRKTYSVGKAKADRVLAALRPSEVAS